MLTTSTDTCAHILLIVLAEFKKQTIEKKNTFQPSRTLSNRINKKKQIHPPMQACLNFQIMDKNFNHLEYIPKAQPPQKMHISSRHIGANLFIRK